MNYHGNDPTTWLWIGDATCIVNHRVVPASTLRRSPTRSSTKTIFVGGQHVWRTTNLGGDRAFLEAHCNTAVGEFGTSDQLYTGNCGDWLPLGSPTLTEPGFGDDEGGGNSWRPAARTTTDTLWADTGAAASCLEEREQRGSGERDVHADRHAEPPSRVPVAFSVDPTNPNHAIVTYSGYNATRARRRRPGHVFDVVYNPAIGTATWTDISYDLGDQPVNDVVRRRERATCTCRPTSASTGERDAQLGTGRRRPAAGHRFRAHAGPTKRGARLLYVATHGRGAYRLVPDRQPRRERALGAFRQIRVWAVPPGAAHTA